MEEKGTLRGHSCPVLSVAFSPDCKTIASASGDIYGSGVNDNTVRLWDVASGAEKCTLRGHSRTVFSIAFSPDGGTIASASEDHTVKIWDATTMEEKGTLREHSHWVNCVAFSPNGSLLASASSDKTVKLCPRWDPMTMEDKGTLNCPLSGPGLDKGGFSALHRATMYGDVDSIGSISRVGGLPMHLARVRGRTAAEIADFFGLEEVSKVLECGLREEMRRAEACLGIAAGRGNAELIGCLLEHGVSPCVRGEGGLSALDHAAAAGEAEVVLQLAAHANLRTEVTEELLLRARVARATSEVTRLVGEYDPSSEGNFLSSEEYQRILDGVLVRAAEGVSMDRSARIVTEPNDMVVGEFRHAAKGIEKLLAVDPYDLPKTLEGMEAEVRALKGSWECKQYGLDPEMVIAEFDYVVNQASSEKDCPQGLRDQGQAGKRLEDFCMHPVAVEVGLKATEVAALRFYTSSAFAAINLPLRDQKRIEEGRKHPLAVVTLMVYDGIKKLRGYGASDASAMKSMVLWRGLKNVRVTDKFVEVGGTELAPMSTTTNLDVAAHYAVGRDCGTSLLFRIVTDNQLQRGVDLKWLSVFPGEAEVLFAPLTYMQPTGRSQKVEAGGHTFTIVEVKTTTS